jgi:hypothetical protein
MVLPSKKGEIYRLQPHRTLERQVSLESPSLELMNLLHFVDTNNGNSKGTAQCAMISRGIAWNRRIAGADPVRRLPGKLAGSVMARHGTIPH